MKVVQKIAVAYIRSKFRLLTAVSKEKAAATAFDLFCTPQSRTLNKLPASFVAAEKINFHFQQYSIAGYRWNKDAQRKALIIHGFESSVINFDQYINPLIEKGYEVLAFDAPAHGRSSGKKINAIVYRDFIKHLQEQYGPFDSFIAHSFGGLCLSLALAETAHSKENRMVLIAPATETSSAMRLFFQFLRITDTAVKKKLEEIILKIGGHPVSWFSVKRCVKHIKANILWLHDETDKITPLDDALKVKEENHPNIQFVITNSLGHSKIYRDAGSVKTIIDFL